MGILPQNLPKQSYEETKTILIRHNVDISKPAVLAVRGYYLNSMGEKKINDKGIYDDAIFMYSPAAYATFNGNTDPSKYRKGRGTGAYKGMATLKKGVHIYRPGIHGMMLYNAGKPISSAPKKPYLAFVQAERFTVIRDGDPDYEEKGWFGINLHMGSKTSTSSEGCQTLYPSQWFTFYNLMMDQIAYFGVKSFPYVLIENF